MQSIDLHAPNLIEQVESGRMITRRSHNIDAASQQLFDVAIVGGGINGACLYNQLVREGRRVVLIDKGDFGSGTSQSSAMMIWGGLLYLGNFDFKAVYDFSRSRDKMIKEMSEWVSPRSFRFLPTPKGKHSALPVGAALWLYWAIGGFRRKRPRFEDIFDQQKSLDHQGASVLFEEGQLAQSDARFVLHWITQHVSSRSIALNHCKLSGGSYHNKHKRWILFAEDQLEDQEVVIRAGSVVNCAGVWTDEINAAFGIQSPFKHVLSKGVFLGLKDGDELSNPMIMDMGEHNDVINSIPWGPITLWGPTETAVSDISKGVTILPEDIKFLLGKYNRSHSSSITKDNIVSLRCGVRPLAVAKSYAKSEYPLEISRRHQIVVDKDKPWISVYGGKLTGCEQLAVSIASQLAPLLPEAEKHSSKPSQNNVSTAETFSFPGLNKPFPGIRWCMEHEYCNTIEDYLRRRTNIAQWTMREGLGRNNEYEPVIRKLCLELNSGDEIAAERHFNIYQTAVESRFDDVLKGV